VSRLAWITLAAIAVGLTVGLGANLIIMSSPAKKTKTAPVTVSDAPQRFSLPLALSPSALALAKHSGDVLVGIAARPGGPVEIAALQAEALLPTFELTVQVDGRKAEAKPCGPGCSRVNASVLKGAPRRLTVRYGKRSLAFELPAGLPPSGAEVFARAKRTMDALRSYKFSERLSSGAATVLTKIDVQAPNRMRVDISNGYRSVIIGKTRWDYNHGRWERTSFPGLNVDDVLMWRQAKNPRVVGRQGKLTELAAFGLQPVPAWFRLTVNPSGHVVEAEMVAPSHFMLHRYKDFNGPVSIKPPALR
jgi:hypothetical protein